MRILDSRRLTGPNLQMPRAGVIAEVAFDAGESPEAAIAAWWAQVESLGTALGLNLRDLRARRFDGGAALSFAAPLDVLLAASDLNDLAIARATAQVARSAHSTSASESLPSATSAAASDLESLALLRAMFAAQSNPRLLALEAEARRRDIPMLADDTSVTLGMGATSRTYPLPDGSQQGFALPAIDEVPWEKLARIPTALITGTNGKTTSARLLAHLLAQSGKRVGLAATDSVSIAGEILERGDFTGPAAARLVLRDPRVEVAVLETARGGILRRGLALEQADCALITNVADDHLGEYGIDSVEALARAKAVVARAVRPGGRIALNADSRELVSLWRDSPEMFAAPIIWFSLDAQGPARELLADHTSRGAELLLLENGQLIHAVGNVRETIIAAKDVPISFGGAALYNLANALGATALALALGVSLAEIARGLLSFRPDGKDNPGRSNLLEGPNGVRVLVDFGHNAHGVHQIAGLVAALRGARPGALTTIAGCAGDRSDENIRALAQEIAAMQPRRVLLRDLVDYLRGREPGEVPRKLAEDLAALALPARDIEIHECETAALRAALDRAETGELILVLVHLESDEVGALLAQRGFHAAQ
jgi:UDP-N-acetylmuramyl tripeptide synthase